MTTTATTIRKNLTAAIDDLETQLRRIQEAHDEIYKIKNILTAANTTGQIVTAEAAASAILQFDLQLEKLSTLRLVSGFAYEINAEATANAALA